jgi:hypothetical protein
MIRKPDGSGLSSLDELLTVANLGLVANEPILRVMRKIIRGLYFHHFTATRGLPRVIPESQVWVGQVYDWSQDDIDVRLTDVARHRPGCFCLHVHRMRRRGWALPRIDSVWLLYAAMGAIFGGTVRSNTYPLIGNQ